MSSRDKILEAANSFKPVPIDIPELGCTFYVRPITIAGLSRFQAACAKDPIRGSAMMMIECICEESGERVFKAEDEAQLNEIPSTIAQRLVEKISEISAITPKAADTIPGN